MAKKDYSLIAARRVATIGVSLYNDREDSYGVAKYRNVGEFQVNDAGTVLQFTHTRADGRDESITTNLRFKVYAELADD